MPNPEIENLLKVVLKFIFVQLGRILLLLICVVLLRGKAWFSYTLSIILFASTILPKDILEKFPFWQRALLFSLLLLLMLVMLPDSFARK